MQAPVKKLPEILQTQGSGCAQVKSINGHSFDGGEINKHDKFILKANRFIYFIEKLLAT